LNIIYHVIAAVFEANADMYQLVAAGKSVPLMKSGSDNKQWYTAFAAGVGSVNGACADIINPCGSGLWFSYRNYLALFTFSRMGDVNARRAMTARMGDLIQAKMAAKIRGDGKDWINNLRANDFRLSKAATNLQLKVNVKMSPLFISVFPSSITSGNFGKISWTNSVVRGY
jgi:hypothetical protein